MVRERRRLKGGGETSDERWGYGEGRGEGRSRVARRVGERLDSTEHRDREFRDTGMLKRGGISSTNGNVGNGENADRKRNGRKWRNTFSDRDAGECGEIKARQTE